MVVCYLGHCLETYHLSVLNLGEPREVAHCVIENVRLIVRVKSSHCQRRGHAEILCSAAAAELVSNSAIVSVHEVEDLLATDSLTILAYAIVLYLLPG